jgi:hydrogenase 3 maturation protease
MDELADKLEKELIGWKKLVFLGIGNEFGGDDSLGILAAKKLKETLSHITGVEVLTTGTAPENFTGVVRRLSPSHIVLVDAAEVGGRGGSVEIIDPRKIKSLMPSTHSLPLYMLAQYLEHELGSKVIILGIQPKRILPRISVSAEVKSSINELALVLKRILEAESIVKRGRI